MGARTYGASEIGAILGLPGAFATPYEVWARRTGRVAPQADNPDMRRGRLLEPGILAMIGDQLGVTVRVGEPYTAPPVVRPELSPYAACHPDGYADELDAVIEAKAPRRSDGWGETGDEVPPCYWLQVQVQLALTGRSHGYLGALIYGEIRLHEYTLVEEGLRAIAAADAWWERHVLGDEAPPLDASPAASAVYSRSVRRGSERIASPEEAEAIEAYLWLSNHIRTLEAERDATRVAILRAAQGEGLRLPGDRARGVRPVAMPGRTTIDTDRLRRERPDIAAEYARQGNPYTQLRTFGVSHAAE